MANALLVDDSRDLVEAVTMTLEHDRRTVCQAYEALKD